MLTFAVPSLTNREHSSAGSEHLPYKQRVRGSNPFAPTLIQKSVNQAFSLNGLFLFVREFCPIPDKKFPIV